MSINWTQLEENAKKVAAADKKKNPKGYVGSASAPSVSTKKTTKTSSSSSTEKLKTKSGGKNKTGSNKAVTTGGKNKQKTATLTTASTKKKETVSKEQQAANREALAATINSALKSENSTYLKTKKKQADAKKTASKAATKADKQANATAKREHRSTPTKTSKKELESGAKRILGESKGYNFLSGLTDSAANNSILGIGYSLITGEKMADGGGQYDDYATTTGARTARKAGEVAGTVGSYLGAYGAASGATGKAATKLLSTKAGRAAAEKAAATKLGTKAGKEATEAALKSAAKDVISDATVGTVMDLGQARSEGLEGTDLAKYMAQQAALNAVLGGAAEAAAPALKAAGKAVKKATDYHWEPRIVNGKTKYVKVADEVTETTSKKTAKVKGTKANASRNLRTKTDTAEEVIDDSKKVAETGDLGAKKGNEEVIEQTADTGETVYTKADELPTKSTKKGATQNPLKTKNAVEEVEQPKVANYVESTPTSAHAEADELVTDAKTGETFIKETPEQTAKVAENATESLGTANKHKSEQLNIIQKTNKMEDDYHTGIRDASDIKTFEEAIEDPESFVYGDFSKADAEEALSNGKVTVYSSKPIEQGGFVSTSKNMAKDFAGDGKIYSQEVDINDVAWINGDEGQYAKVGETPLDRNPIKTDADGKQTVGGFEVEGNSSNLGIVNPSVQELDELFETAESKWKTAYRNLVNRQAAIDDLAKASGNDAVADAVQAVRSASGTTEYILTKNLVSPEGEILLDKSYASLFEGMSDSDRELFNEYAQNLNNIARWKQDKPLDASVTAEMSQKRVDEILAIRPDFAQRTANINEWWNTFTHSWLVDTGRMTEDAWQAMTSKYPNYVPAFMPKKGNKGGVKTGFGKFSVKSGTHEAKAGTTLERMPIEDAFMEQISQIVSGSRKNNLIVEIIDTLKSNPDALKHFGIAKDVNDIPMANFDVTDLMSQWEKDSMEKVSDKVYTISGMQNGQKVMAYISADMADAIGTMNKIIDSAPARWFTGFGKAITNPMKGAITQLNPLFAIANLSRDIPTALIQSQYGVGTTAKNMFKAVKEIATNGEYWQKYMAMGGKSSGYIKANSGFKKNLAANKTVGQQMWEGLKTVFGAAGEVTESVPRLAEFISSLENGNSVYKALTDSAEVTVNFSRAGAVTKTADAWVMYLNAAVQGLDKFARTMKNAPLRTATSSLAVVGAPYAMLTAYNWANPNYQDLSDRTKQNYFCIPNLMGEVDENGYAKTFIKVPLNREYGTIFASTMDVIAGYMSGEENPWNGLSDTINTNFLPASPLSDNVLAPIFINLPQNKDFAGRNIVSSNLEDVSPQYQYDGTTSGAAMAIARAANNLHIPSDTLKSPQKVDYLLDSYGGYFGSLAQAATDQGNQGLLDAIKGLTIDPVEDRFTADARYSSGVQQAFYDAKEKATTAWNDIKVTTGEKGKEYIEYKTYNAIQQELSDLSKQEKEILNDSSLTNAQKSEQAKAIREQKNEVARGAKERVAEAVAEYEKNPDVALMTSSQKEAYNKVSSKISEDDYVKAKELTSDIDNNTAEAFVLAENGLSEKATKAMTSKSAYKKAQELKEVGATQQDVINAAKTLSESGYKKSVGKAYALLDSGQSSDVVSILVSESAVNRAKAIKRAGITPEMLEVVAEKIDTDENGYYKADEELKPYLNSANLSREQKYAIFEALKANPNTYNPYG